MLSTSNLCIPGLSIVLRKVPGTIFLKNGTITVHISHKINFSVIVSKYWKLILLKAISTQAMSTRKFLVRHIFAHFVLTLSDS